MCHGFLSCCGTHPHNRKDTMNIPKSVRTAVFNDLHKYKVDNNISNDRLAKKIGCCTNMVHKWLKGIAKPTRRSIRKIREAGITNVMLPEERKRIAVETILVSEDNKNKPKRKYTRRVTVNGIVRKEVSGLLDDYVRSLGDKKSLVEHLECRDTLIQKLMYVCRQRG